MLGFLAQEPQSNRFDMEAARDFFQTLTEYEDPFLRWRGASSSVRSSLRNPLR